MSPLGDRLLVKPEDEAKVQTALLACLTSAVSMTADDFAFKQQLRNNCCAMTEALSLCREASSHELNLFVS